MINRVVQRSCLLALVFASFITHAETIQIPLSGVGEVPSSTDMVVNPALLENGEVEVGSQKVQEFEISHTGDADSLPVEIWSIEIGGQDSYEFSADYAGYNILEVDQTIKFGVSFNPVTLGYKKAFLKIEHSGENSPHLVLLTGIGIDVPSSELKYSDTDLDFGSAETDKNATKTLTITNSGGAGYPAINIYSVMITGESSDAFTTNFTDATLDPGQSIKIITKMNSSFAGKKTATLTIDHDGSNPTIRVDLEGAVTLPPVIEPTPTPDPVDDDPIVNNNNNNNEPVNEPVNNEPVNNEPNPEPVNNEPVNNEPVNNEPKLTEPDFLNTLLAGATPKKPTSLQFGPDGHLYVSERDGYINQYQINRTNKNVYKVTKTDKIGLVQQIKNHDDDGQENPNVKGRLVTGIFVAGTANAPIIYVSSADPRMGAGPSGNDSNLDTNSVILSRITKNGTKWVKKDLVRGLPRSEENHQGNGIQLSADGKTLYIAMGGHTNMGLPSNNFARIPEYALSAAIVEINLQQIGNTTYDLPTLDDEDRPGTNDNNDPFGGNNGKNMAILNPNSPVKIYAPGFRNSYDLLITEQGRMYTVDNGPNANWGDKPAANCLNNYADGGNTYGDNLHFIKNKGYYGGHPNPTRGSKNNKFNDSNPQTPLAGAANPVECQYKIPGQTDNALHVFKSSTNGLTEYTASNFSGSMKGDLLAASFNKSIYRVQLNNTGTKLVGLDKLFTNLGTPLDVTAQGNTDKFPGTVWVADYAQNAIHVYEPKDY